VPKTIFDRQVREDKLRILLLGYASASGKTSTEISEIMGCSRPTAAKKLKEPELLTVGELRRMRKGLGIPEDEMLSAMKF